LGSAPLVVIGGDLFGAAALLGVSREYGLP
jgi:hypothetical protein